MEMRIFSRPSCVAAEDLALVGGFRFGGQIVAQKTGGVVEGETEGADFFVEFLEGEEAVPKINGGVECLGGRALREAAEAGHFLGVIAGDLAAGAGDAEAVEQFEKVATDGRDEITSLALTGGAFGVGPAGEMSLGEAGRLFDGGDVEVFGEGGVGERIASHIAAGDEGDLVAQVGELVVHRCGGEKEDLGASAAGDNVLHQGLVAGAFLGFAGALGG